MEGQIAALPAHAKPPMRELGRRSEAANHPFHGPAQADSHDRVAATVAAFHRGPLALVGKVGRREEVVAACDGAAALGITIGMAATHARALVSDLDIRPSETEADAAMLDQLAPRAVRRWSPIAAATPPDGLWLDLTGCAHLHGGEERFCRRLRAFCQRAGFTARVAVADTPGAAHAIARFGPADIAIVPTGRTVDALSGLPVAALRLAGTALVAARKFGFERVADLLPVARGPLARRLGLAAITRLDQALGAVAEPITPRTDEVMVERGYPREFAERTFRQLEGFGSYGFPESHAASFAKISYASSWMKHHHPDVFCASLMNAQPMGFCAPAQIVRDAREHGVVVRPPCVNASRWDCTLEPYGGRYLAVRLGLRQIRGLSNADGQDCRRARADRVRKRGRCMATIWRPARGDREARRRRRLS